MRSYFDAHSGNVPQDTLWINNEKSTKCNALFLDEDAVVSGYLHVTVCQERQPEIRTQATLLTGLVGPREVRILRVSRYSKDLSIEFLELAECVIEGKDFGWTNEGKVPEVYE